MSLKDDIIEAACCDVMRRVLEPVDDGTPDPQVNFDACVTALADRVSEEVLDMSRSERRRYFVAKARETLAWYNKIGIDGANPAVSRVRAWLGRLA
jgi:hypothetical protein